MNHRLIIRIAWQLLRARMKQSLVAATGVTFGIAMFVALLSFMTGLNALLDQLILNRTPHIRLYNEIRPSDQQPLERAEDYLTSGHFIRSIKPRETGTAIRNSEAILEALRRDPRVAGVAPKLMAPVFFQSGTILISGQLNGIDPIAERDLFKLGDYVIEGDLMDLAQTGNFLFLGKGIADKMLVRKGDLILLTTADGQPALMKIGGIIQFGLADFDNTQSFCSIRTAQQIAGVSVSHLTDLQIKLHDIRYAPDIAKEFSTRFRVDAIDIRTANAQFETGSDVRNIISYAVGITLLVVAGFGIYNILNMLIYEKMDSIAILKATGFSGGDVKRIFLSISTLIGVSGGMAGLLLGYLLSVGIDNVPFETEALPTVKTFPVNYNPMYYVIGLTFSILTTYIAGILPARKAATIDPVVIIRGK